MNFFIKLYLILFIIFSSLYQNASAEIMTLEEKIGQLFMVHFRGEVANEEAKALIQDTKVGGIIYYKWANGLYSPTQIQKLSESLQNLAKTPLFIAVDQEGGIVSRLTDGFTLFPGNYALGRTQDPDLSEEASYAIGLELLSVGINMNLAPVVDVNINPRNPIIGIRSFSNQPDTVTAFGKKALNGYKKANIIATLKHFPGHGDVETDSHEDLPVVNKTWEDLQKVELLPFSQLASSADAIMTAHLLVPAFDTEHCSTLSEKTLTYLKNNLGFQGVIISDSLVMEGVLKKCHSVEEAAIQAVNAGCDILLIGGKLKKVENRKEELSACDIQRIHAALVQAVKEGRIQEKRISEAAEKIRLLKKRNLFPNDPNHHSDHELLAKKIANLAIETIENKTEALDSLNQKKIAVIAPECLLAPLAQTSILKIGKTTHAHFFPTYNLDDEAIETAKQCIEDAEILIICSYNAWKNPAQKSLIESLLASGIPTIFIAAGEPLDATLFPQADLIFNTFSPTAVSLQAAINRLFSYCDRQHPRHRDFPAIQ